MSRFWAGASSSDSDDSSNDDSSYFSSDEDAAGGKAAAGGANRWVDFSDSDSDDSEARVVKSGKDRAIETFNKHIVNIRKAMKDRDYFEMQTQFDELSKAMVKNKKILQEGIPRPVVRILVDLEDYVPERLADKAAFKKLSARQGRALNRMKLTLKKHNKPYSVVMEHYRKNPDTGDDEDDDAVGGDGGDGGDDSDSDSSDSSSSDDSSSSSSSDSDKKGKKGSDEDSDKDDSGSGEDDEDSINWADDDDDSTSSDSAAGDDAFKGLEGRAKWLKKVPTTSNKKKDRQKEEPLKIKSMDGPKKEANVTSKDHEAIRAPKSVIPEEELTAAILNRKVHDIASQRGRRGTDPRQLLRQFEGLSRLSMKFGPRVEIPILMYVISAQFSLQRNMDDYMDTPTWRACATYLERIGKVIVEDGYRLGVQNIDEVDLFLGSGKMANRMKAAAMTGGEGALEAVGADEKLVDPHTGEQETEDERAERLRVEKEEGMSEEEKKTIPVAGSLSLHMTRLEEEYTKSLQNISHHTEEYVMRLRDESKLVSLLAKMQVYFEREGMTTEAAQMAELHLKHIYYRHDSIADQVDKAAEFFEIFGEVGMLHPACVSNQRGGKDTATSHPGASSGKPVLEDANSVTAKADYSSVMGKLCTFVYKHGTDQAKKRATICQVYHHALHDRFLDGRDLLLMSHLQENIYDVGDITTMILFNRMMAQLGMCAFRQGKIWEAHQCLTEICSGKVRELLAQGMSLGRYSDKTPEQEKAEKRRQVPYHQHINLDLLEACHLISAMLLEVPNMAAVSVGSDAANGRRSRPISRAFRKHQEIYSHQFFTGPPEQTRDFVMRAAKALSKGDWETCVDLCTAIEVWSLVPGDDAADSIKAMLASKIKLEGLRTYLFAFSAQYDSLSLDQLCAMFEMSKNEVHSVVSKMMINRDLYAAWDQPTATIVLKKADPSPVQLMALQFAEKVGHLVEANERLLDASSGNKEDFWKGGRGDNQDGDRFGNRGRGGYNQGGGFNRGNKQSSGGGRGPRRDGGTKGRGRSGRKSSGRGGNQRERRGNKRF